MADNKLEYKNQEEIEDPKQNQKVRGERILTEDKEVLPQPLNQQTSFGTPDKVEMEDEFIELHVYDGDNNFLESIHENIEWSIKKAEGGKTTTGDQLILKPGNDLRKAGFTRGDYKVRYHFHRRLAGANEVILTKTVGEDSGIVHSSNPQLTGVPMGEFFVEDDGRVFVGTNRPTDGSEPTELDIKAADKTLRAFPNLHCLTAEGRKGRSL